jgi:hypothetical protein
MKALIATLVVLLALGTGCASKKGVVASATTATGPASPGRTNSAAPPKVIVTPETGLVGKVASYNDAGRFVVVNFSGGRLPAVEQRLFVYRQDLKVGELKVDKWQMAENVVADLLAGEARPGDEVRDQ